MTHRLGTALTVATAFLLAACTTTTPVDQDSSTPPAVTQVSNTATATPSATILSNPSSVTATSATGDPPTSTTAPTISPTGAATSSTTSTATTDPTLDPVTIPTTFTTQQRKSADEAIIVWRHAIKIYDESLQNPSGEDWKPIVYRYINDPAAVQQLNLIDTFVKQGIHQIGAQQYNAEVTAATAENVQIKACVENGTFDVIDANGKSVVKPGAPQRFYRQFSISFYAPHDYHWFLNNITTPDPVQPC